MIFVWLHEIRGLVLISLENCTYAIKYSMCFQTRLGDIISDINQYCFDSSARSEGSNIHITVEDVWYYGGEHVDPCLFLYQVDMPGLFVYGSFLFDLPRESGFAMLPLIVQTAFSIGVLFQSTISLCIWMTTVYITLIDNHVYHVSEVRPPWFLCVICCTINTCCQTTMRWWCIRENLCKIIIAGIETLFMTHSRYCVLMSWKVIPLMYALQVLYK